MHKQFFFIISGDVLFNFNYPKEDNIIGRHVQMIQPSLEDK